MKKEIILEVAIGLTVFLIFGKTSLSRYLSMRFGIDTGIDPGVGTPTQTTTNQEEIEV